MEESVLHRVKRKHLSGLLVYPSYHVYMSSKEKDHFQASRGGLSNSPKHVYTLIPGNCQFYLNVKKEVLIYNSGSREGEMI